jgi:protein-S-isoprenylcysteine O-methyltransferase Ste14
LETDRSIFVRRLIVATLWNAGVFGLALFGAAGTIHWWRGWVLLGMIVLATVATMLGVFRTRPDLLKERMKGIVQKGQPMGDRVIVLAFLVTYAGSIAFIPLDVFYFHIFAKPPIWVSMPGIVLFAVGWLIISLSFRDNAFAVPVVRHQTERQHTVVDWGVYSVVRHPLYAGLVLLEIGMPFWLESYAAAIAILVPIALLIVRIFFEEQFLRRELAGYEAYTKRVKYRLIPFLW